MRVRNMFKFKLLHTHTQLIASIHIGGERKFIRKLLGSLDDSTIDSASCPWNADANVPIETVERRVELVGDVMSVDGEVEFFTLWSRV